MIRLAGMLAGSLLGAAILVVVAGVPRLAGPDATAEIAEPVPAAAPDTAKAVPAPASAAPPAEAPASPEPGAATQAGDIPTEAPPAAALTPDRASASPPAAAAVPAGPPPLRWHAFWSPFRSRVAANGFVAELSRVTGLDYRVVALKSGVYEVAFGYEDELEIDAKLATIRAATGLEIPGS